MTAIFFNLLANSALSLAAGILVISLAIWFFRIETGPWKLFLLSLPFVKIVYDCLQGIPANSILLTGIDPFLLPPKHQAISIGGGLSSWWPVFDLKFSVQDLNGHEYAASIGDYLVIWLNRKFGAEVPLAIVVAIVTVATTLVVVRCVHAWRFERRRKADRPLAQTIELKRMAGRQIDIYVSDAFSGTPFTGGCFRPYICIPRDAFLRLDVNELQAVVAHELGHIRQFDVVVTVLIQLLGDLFWFVPGYRWLSRKVDRLREIVADQWAVKSGIAPARLASSLLKLKEIPEPNERFVLYSAFFREPSLLKTRVERLLDRHQEKRPRLGWQNRWLRMALAAWIGAAVMLATLGGNHQERSMRTPEQIENWLRAKGLSH